MICTNWSLHIPFKQHKMSKVWEYMSCTLIFWKSKGNFYKINSNGINLVVACYILKCFCMISKLFVLPEGEAKIKYEFLHTSFTAYWHKVSKEFPALCTGIIAIHENKSSLSGSFYWMTERTQSDRKFMQVAAV